MDGYFDACGDNESLHGRPPTTFYLRMPQGTRTDLHARFATIRP